MIISENKKPPLQAFEKLLENAHQIIKKESNENSDYFIQRTATEFEVDIFDSLKKASKNTPFENTIELISGHKFPDIIAHKLYGVEVKTTKQNHWRSTGNSVFESTRVDQVENIFIYFGRLTNPVDFKYRRYQECLYDIAVTHSPRYLIDMNLKEGETIFSKLEIEYDQLRNLNNPVKPFINYYRKQTKPGEEPWWMDEEKGLVSPTIKIYSNLPKEEKTRLVIEAMAFFPEIFGKSPTKYQRVAGWLAGKYGIVDPSLRDRFTAGGKIDITIDSNSYTAIPRIFKNLASCFKQVITTIKSADIDDLQYYWGLKNLSTYDDLTAIWLQQVFDYSNKSFPEGNQFIAHLFGDSLGEEKPEFVKELYLKFGLG